MSQKEDVKKLLELVQQYPDVEIVPMITLTMLAHGAMPALTNITVTTKEFIFGRRTKNNLSMTNMIVFVAKA